MDIDHDLPDVDFEGLDADLGAHVPPPDEPAPPGRRPARDSDSWLARSPWWCLPLIVTTLIGVERVLMVVTAPGAREWSIAIFGALFIITSGAFLTVGGLVIGHHRYK
ncbi:MAG: hypothetical protein AB8H79_26850 [Myxococcota bacterium]